MLNYTIWGRDDETYRRIEVNRCEMCARCLYDGVCDIQDCNRVETCRDFKDEKEFQEEVVKRGGYGTA